MFLTKSYTISALNDLKLLLNITLDNRFLEIKLSKTNNKKLALISHTHNLPMHCMSATTCISCVKTTLK